MSAEIILHRNLLSPYCEKIILALIESGLTWKSALTSKSVPRNELAVLVGEYSRRVPVLQHGADLYCDTSTIMHAIANLSGQSRLSPFLLTDVHKQRLCWIETELNTALLMSLPTRAFVLGYFKKLPWAMAWEFLKDRARLVNAYPAVKQIRSSRPWEALAKTGVKKLAHYLAEHLYFSGESAANALDFSAFTMMWYYKQIHNMSIFTEHSNLMAWFARMSSISSEYYDEVTAEYAIQHATEVAPSLIDTLGIKTQPTNKTIRVEINDSLGAAIGLTVVGRQISQNDHFTSISRPLPLVGANRFVHLHIANRCHGACG